MPFISASVISPYNSIRGGAEGGLVPAGLLLDLYPNAAAAYSLRKLRTTYAGPAIEARKTVAGTTFVQDIGFVDNELDTASLLSFANGDDVFVAKWYDQSGGNDAVNITESSQPQIVNNGVVITVNNASAVYFNGATNFIETTTLTKIEQPTSYFGVFKFDLNQNQNIFDGSSTGNRQVIGDSGTTTYKLFGGTQITGGVTNTNQNSFNGILSTTDSLFINNISVISGNAGFDGIDEIVIGSNVFRNGAFLNGKIQEFILYPLDQTTNRTAIEANINSNYNIYWDGSQTGLLDDYPNAVAAYSLRALNSAYTGPAIEARRSSDDDVQDIGFLYNGSLDTESLLTFADGGDVFVAKWYDQSKEGNDVIQPFDAQQPQIVDLGSVVTLNGKPTILSSVGKAMYTASNSVPVVGDLGERSSFSVLNSSASGLQAAISYVDGGTNLFFPIAFNTGIALSRNNDPASNATAPYTANSDVVFTSLLNSTNSEVFLNGVSGGGLTGFIPQTGTSKINVFARYANVWNLIGQVSEIILYPSDQTANRVEIETNINNHYTIYP